MIAARARPVDAGRGCRLLLLALAAASGAFLGGCAQTDGTSETGELPGMLPSMLIEMRSEAIIGGVVSYGDPAVVMVITADGVCTGSLIAPRVVLTAAHCMERSSREPVATGSVRFGSGVDNAFFARRSIVDMFVHPRYGAGLVAGPDIVDMGVIRLDEPAPADVLPLLLPDAPVTAALVGDRVRAVGFGVSDGQAQTGAGVKRTVELDVLELDRQYIHLGDERANVCQGDSGGPILHAQNGVEALVGIASFGEAGCAGPSRTTRVDIHVDVFLRELLAVWDGPCQSDGVCDPVQPCSAYPDPDCDVCGVNGICSESCPDRPVPDLDCPVAEAAGAPCAERPDCELPPDGGCAVAQLGQGGMMRSGVWLLALAILLLRTRSTGRRRGLPRP